MRKANVLNVQNDKIDPVTAMNSGDSLRQSPGDAVHRPLIEIGWIVAGRMDEPDRKAAAAAREESRHWLQESFPEFEWKVSLVERFEAVQDRRVAPVDLLDYGVTEGKLRRWDFSIVITAADLISHYKNEAFAVVSRALQAAVISTARIDPRANQPDVASDQRITLMTQRICAIAIHMIGHLAGLEHETDPTSFMFDFDTVAELDPVNSLGVERSRQLRTALQRIADSRLEEKKDVRKTWSALFYLQAAWINFRPIVQAVWQARPWQFPFRFSRLTTAAASAMAVLMITAEVWELSLLQPPTRLGGLAAAAILLTTVYVVFRQRLFVQREHLPISELSVVTNISTFLIVLVGMAATFVFLALVTFTVGNLFFAPRLISSWAATTSVAGNLSAYIKLATLVASVGMFIGALGASFESHQYFRHITFVDEEL